MFIIAGVWCDASGLWMRLKRRSLLGQDRTLSFHRASGQLVFINVLLYKNINAMFECYPRQERMKEWQKRSCRLQRWCLILLQKTQGDTRRVQDCQKHPCQLACLISIRWFIFSIISTIPSMISSLLSLARIPTPKYIPQSYPEDADEMVAVPDIVFTRASSLASGGRTPRKGSLNPWN